MARKVHYLSFTGFKTASPELGGCLESYRHRYIDKVPVVDADQTPWAKGNALHHLMEAYILTGKDNPRWLVENAADFWTAELASIQADPKQMLSWNDEQVAAQGATLLDWATKLAGIFEKHKLDPARMPF